MLPLKHVTKHRLKSLFSTIPTLSNNYYPFVLFPNTYNYASLSATQSSSSTCGPSASFIITQNDIAATFKTWFGTRHKTLDPLLPLCLPNPHLRRRLLPALSALSEPFVLHVLRHGSEQNDTLSCLKFFDWAGRHPHFHHTRATFISIFRILTRANLIPLVVDFLSFSIRFGI